MFWTFKIQQFGKWLLQFLSLVWCSQVETRDSFKQEFIGACERVDYEASRSSHRALLLF